MKFFSEIGAKKGGYRLQTAARRRGFLQKHERVPSQPTQRQVSKGRSQSFWLIWMY